MDEAHWAGLPRVGEAPGDLVRPVADDTELMASRSAKAHVAVARRDLATYDAIGAVA